jgi:hypothetical protein
MNELHIHKTHLHYLHNTIYVAKKLSCKKLFDIFTTHSEIRGFGFRAATNSGRVIISADMHHGF